MIDQLQDKLHLTLNTYPAMLRKYEIISENVSITRYLNIGLAFMYV